MDRLWMDLRLAVRGLVKRPLLASTIVVTLALGIGANATVFGVIDSLVLRPYTLPEVDSVVMPVQTAPNETGRRESVSPANFLDWRRDLSGGPIEHLSAMRWWEANLMGRDEPEHALGFQVSPGFFAAIGTSPAIGREFRSDEALAATGRSC